MTAYTKQLPYNLAAVHEVAPDTLPYFDEGYDDPGVREMVGFELKTIVDSYQCLYCPNNTKLKQQRSQITGHTSVQVNQLVEEETRRYRPTKNYLEFFPTPDYDAFEVIEGVFHY